MQSIRSAGLWRALMNALHPLGRFLPPSIYSHLWFRGPFTARVHGVRLTMHHTGSELENQVFWRSTFEGERGTVEIAAHLLRGAEVLIDVGANSGFFSLLAKAAAPAIRVIAIEASPFNFEALQRNIAANGFDIVAIEAAATAHDGEVTFYDFPSISYSASVEAHWREATVERRVPGFTLDTIARENGIAGKRVLIKIDVEGHEVAVLEGARDLIASGPTFLIEIIRDYVAAGVAGLLPPTQFDYHFIREQDGSTVDETDKVRRGENIPHGNYLVTPSGSAIPSISLN